MRVLFTAMCRLNASILRFRKQSANGTYELAFANDIRKGVEWETYGSEIRSKNVLIPHPEWTTGLEAREELVANGAHQILDCVENELREGKHEELTIRCEPFSGCLFVQAWHSSTLAPDPAKHAIYVGGLRRETIDDDESQLFRTTLHHARTMSHKNAIAGANYGGCKLTIIADPLAGDHAFYGWLGFCIDESRSITAPEVGIGPEEADVLRERFTPHIVGGVRGPLGPTSWSTAEGVVAAGQQALLHAGFENLYRNARVAIQGIGEVGTKIAELVLERGAQVILADIVPQRATTFVNRHPDFANRIEVVNAEKLLFQPCEILMPCAHNRVIGEEHVQELACRILLGAANDELAVNSVEEELRLADRFAEAGILFQVAWVHNIGGVLQAVAEYESHSTRKLEELMQFVSSHVGGITHRNLETAREAKITPTRAAYQTAHQQLYPEE